MTVYTVIIPCYNEEKTIRHVVKVAASAKNVGQVLVVDDGSTDKSVLRATDISPTVEIIAHQKNMGKGAAVRTGIAHARFENIVFIDADLTNITGEMIYTLVEPLLNKQADFVKASFTRARGRVTEIAVKPMMQILFPQQYFEQPISGQFAGKLSFLKTIKIIEDWGLDIGILLDAISHRLRIVEVFIGELEHKAQSEQSLARMSEQVLRTMIQKAGLLSNKYKLVVFSFDECLVKNYSLKEMMAFLGKATEFEGLCAQYARGDLLELEYYQHLAGLMEGMPVERLREYAAALDLRTYAQDVISHLQRRHFRVGLVGTHFVPVMKVVAERLGIDIVEGIDLRVTGKKLTGKMTRISTLAWFNVPVEEGLLNALRRAVSKADTSLENTILVASETDSVVLLQVAGLSIAYRPKSKQVRLASNKTISILPELLVLVE